jgi:hypothetical protein
LDSYTRFHPRQACFGGNNKSSGAGTVTVVGLYNASQGSQYLVVRHFTCLITSTVGAFFSNIQGNLNSTLAVPQKMWAGEAAPAGRIWTAAPGTTPVTPDNFALQGNVNYNWPNNLPVSILPPGYSFVVGSDGGVNISLYCSFMWEELQIEELNPDRLLQAQLAIAENGL